MNGAYEMRTRSVDPCKTSMFGPVRINWSYIASDILFKPTIYIDNGDLSGVLIDKYVRGVLLDRDVDGEDSGFLECSTVEDPDGSADLSTLFTQCCEHQGAICGLKVHFICSGHVIIVN